MDADAALVRLSQAYTLIDLEIEGAPTYFSIALPQSAEAIGLQSFPEAATPSRGRTANGRGLEQNAKPPQLFGRSCRAIELPVPGAMSKFNPRALVTLVI